MAVQNVDKTTLKNAQDAAEKAKSTAGDATKAASSLADQAQAKIDEAKGAVDAAKDKVAGATGGITGKISELTSNVTKNIPDGVKKIGGQVLGLDADGIVTQTVGELKTTVKHATNAVDFLTGKKSFGDTLAGFSRGGENPQPSLDNAATGKLRTFIMPEDFNPDLCFRIDFLKFSRQSVFEAQKAKPVATFVFPLPKTIAAAQGSEYDTQELGTTGDIEARLRNFDKGSGILSSIAADALGSFGTNVFRNSLSSDVGRGISQAIGFIPNPHLSNIFKGVPLRTFSFDVSMAPRNSRESEVLQNVLDHYRSYILPALSVKKTTLDYPHEAAISFSASGSSLVAGGTGKTPLDRIFNFKRVVCKDVSITVNGQPGTQVFFADQAPAEVTISFSFQEVAISVANDYGHKQVGKKADDLLDKVMSKPNAFGKAVSDAKQRVKDDQVEDPIS